MLSGASLIIKVAGIGILTSVINEILKTSGKGDWVSIVTLLSMIVGFTIVVGELYTLIQTIQTMFMW